MSPSKNVSALRCDFSREQDTYRSNKLTLLVVLNWSAVIQLHARARTRAKIKIRFIAAVSFYREAMKL